jgi:hypothetical protein
MYIIEQIYIELSNVIKDRVRLYNDDYNENCFGDHFQNKGSSTILFESGFFENDYNREITRKYMFHSLVIALELISDEINDKIKVDIYELIPKNKVKFYDIIIKKIKIDDSIINVGINYKEILKDNSISFVPYIESIGDLDNFLGHKEFEFPSNYLKTFNSNTFIIGNKLNESLIKLLKI